MRVDPDDGRRQIRQIAAHVLSNRQPPYAIRGGVFDVLTESGGEMLAADNLETLPRLQLFEEMEGIDIDPASAVALATLLKAARSGLLEHDALVLLNVTGGGRHRRARRVSWSRPGRRSSWTSKRSTWKTPRPESPTCFGKSRCA